MARIASTTSAGVPTGPAMTLDALMLRAKQVAAAGSRINADRPMISPWQGAAYMGDVLANKINQGRADAAVAEGRQGLSEAMAGISPEGPTSDQIAQVSQYDPDMGMQLWRMAAEAMQSRRARQQQLADRDAGWAHDARVTDDKRLYDEHQLIGKRVYEQADQIADEKRATDAQIAQEQRAADLPQSTSAKVLADFQKGHFGDPTSPEAQALRDDALEKANAITGAGLASERKALWEMQDEYINSTAAVSQLQKARGLLDEGINWGYTAGAQTMADQGLGMDPDRANRTKEYDAIMNQEAIAAMSQALKGATTDTEMAEFIKNMNNPTLDPKVKRNQIDAMIAKAQARNEQQAARITSLNGTLPKVNMPDPVAEEKTLQDARDAIAKGAPAELVRKRLVDKGFDPGKL